MRGEAGRRAAALQRARRKAGDKGQLNPSEVAALLSSYARNGNDEVATAEDRGVSRATVRKWVGLQGGFASPSFDNVLPPP